MGFILLKLIENQLRVTNDPNEFMELMNKKQQIEERIQGYE